MTLKSYLSPDAKAAKLMGQTVSGRWDTPSLATRLGYYSF
jgi:hypothetical protein